MEPQRFKVSRTDAGQRLGSYLASRLGECASQRAIKRELERGCCTVNGELETRSSRRLDVGDRVAYRGGDDPGGARRLEIRPAAILHEDDSWILYDKPAGFPCQPTGSGGRPDLFTELRRYLSGRDGRARLEQVHRLDRDTSGVMLYAKSGRLAEAASRIFRARRVQKTYLALVRGVLRPGEGRWETQVGGRTATTDYRVTETFGRRACLVELHPRTGRKHQLRVQLAAAGHPVLGDVTYGRDRAILPDLVPSRHLLHASRLAFDDPETGERVEGRARPTGDFRRALQSLRGGRR